MAVGVGPPCHAALIRSLGFTVTETAASRRRAGGEPGAQLQTSSELSAPAPPLPLEARGPDPCLRAAGQGCSPVSGGTRGWKHAAACCRACAQLLLAESIQPGTCGWPAFVLDHRVAPQPAGCARGPSPTIAVQPHSNKHCRGLTASQNTGRACQPSTRTVPASPGSALHRARRCLLTKPALLPMRMQSAAAIQALNGTTVGGSQLVVKFADSDVQPRVESGRQPSEWWCACRRRCSVPAFLCRLPAAAQPGCPLTAHLCTWRSCGAQRRMATQATAAARDCCCARPLTPCAPRWPTCCSYCRNLPPTYSRQEVGEMFMPFGTVMEIRM